MTSRRFHHTGRTLILLAALFLLLSSCGSRSDAPEEAVSPADPDSSAAPESPVSVPTAVSPENTAEPSLEPDGEDASEPEDPLYDFSQPAPESEAVEKTYFDDAAFVGDSRTDGFLIYSGIGRGKNLTSNGLSIFKLAEKKALKIGGRNYTLLEALGLEQYGKVYLSLGINELGCYDDEGFYRCYCSAIEAIRKVQPDAVIYIQGLIPLNEKRVSETSRRSYLKNDKLRLYNKLMRQAAEEEQVIFLDLYSAFVDEDGSLPYDASRDGVHLNKDYCHEWLSYLQTHTVDSSLFFRSRTDLPAPAEPDIPVPAEPIPPVPAKPEPPAPVKPEPPAPAEPEPPAPVEPEPPVPAEPEPPAPAEPEPSAPTEPEPPAPAEPEIPLPPVPGADTESEEGILV